MGAVGVGAAAFAFWPKPLEHDVPEADVLECVAAAAEVPTEYAARMVYAKCLAGKREEARVRRWADYYSQLRIRNEDCFRGGYCPPEPRKPDH